MVNEVLAGAPDFLGGALTWFNFSEVKSGGSAFSLNILVRSSFYVLR